MLGLRRTIAKTQQRGENLSYILRPNSVQQIVQSAGLAFHRFMFGTQATDKRTGGSALSYGSSVLFASLTLLLSLAKMLSGANAFRISHHQIDPR